MARGREGEAGKRSPWGLGRPIRFQSGWQDRLGLPRCFGLPGGFPSVRRLRLGAGARFSLQGGN
jgi:hypothetical protein